MVCPRCGTVATSKSSTCARCGGSLSRPEINLPEPPTPRSPTHRGELQQRAAGIEPTVLAHPKPRTPAVPEVTRYTPPPASAPPPAPPEGQAWPPPPATWEPVPAAAGPSGTAPPPHWTPPDPSWAPPPAWGQGGQPQPAAPSAPTHQWSATHRWTSPLARTRGDSPPYFWQSLVCLFLFPPTGIAAVVYSVLVTKRTQLGDSAGAARASYLARVWCLWSLVGMAAGVVIGTVSGVSF